MSSLLEFQHTMAEKNEAIYSIETGELNPEELELSEMKETKTKFPVMEYNLKSLREYINQHSSILAESGNVIKGEVKGKTVILTVLKIK